MPYNFAGTHQFGDVWDTSIIFEKVHKTKVNYSLCRTLFTSNICLDVLALTIITSKYWFYLKLEIQFINRIVNVSVLFPCKNSLNLCIPYFPLLMPQGWGWRGIFESTTDKMSSPNLKIEKQHFNSTPF